MKKINLIFCLLALLHFFVQCRNITKTNDTIETNKITELDGSYKELLLDCKVNDGISNNCKYGDINIKIDYINNPNNIIIKKGEQKFTYNFNFFFEGIETKCFLFQKKEIKILLMEFGYEYGIQVFVFKITNNEICFLKKINIELYNDRSTFFKYKLFEIDDGIKIRVNNYSFDINFKNEADISQTKSNINFLPLGNYYIDEFNDYEVFIKIESDSIIYTEIGKEGSFYNQYLLEPYNIKKDILNLKYLNTLNGYTGDALKYEIFGTIFKYDKKIYFESEYLKVKFGVLKTEIKLLK